MKQDCNLRQSSWEQSGAVRSLANRRSSLQSVLIPPLPLVLIIIDFQLGGLFPHLKINHSSLRVKVAQSCLTICDLGDCGLPDSSVRGIFPARILEWAAIPSQRSNAGLLHCRHIIYHLRHQGSQRGLRWLYESEMLVTQSCPPLCDPMDCSPIGSTVQGILQGIFSFPRGSSWPRNRTCISCTACRFFTFWATRHRVGSPNSSLEIAYLVLRGAFTWGKGPARGRERDPHTNQWAVP